MSAVLLGKLLLVLLQIVGIERRLVWRLGRGPLLTLGSHPLADVLEGNLDCLGIIPFVHLGLDYVEVFLDGVATLV